MNHVYLVTETYKYAIDSDSTERKIAVASSKIHAMECMKMHADIIVNNYKNIIVNKWVYDDGIKINLIVNNNHYKTIVFKYEEISYFK